VGIFSSIREPLDSDIGSALMFGDANALKIAGKYQQRIKDRFSQLRQPGESLQSIITSVTGRELLVLTTHRVIHIDSITSDFDLNVEGSMILGTEIGALGTPPHSFLATIRYNRPVRGLGGKRAYSSSEFEMITRRDYDEALLVTSTVRRTLGCEML
jgi:hypothetical protein